MMTYTHMAACRLSPRRGAPWTPSEAGSYRLPGTVHDRLTSALAGFRNRDAAYALAQWLGRFWSSPKRLLYSFPIDRRAIACRDDLGLSEARVRGAIETLEDIGFLARYEPDPGKRYQRTAEGLKRRPILFRFAEEFAAAFTAANARAQAARGAAAPARRPIAPPAPTRAPLANLLPCGTTQTRRPANPLNQVAQKQSLGEAVVIMGEKIRPAPDNPLEAAIERLRRGVGL